MDFDVREHLAASLEAVEAALLSEEFFERLGDLGDVTSGVLLEHREDGAAVVRRVAYRFSGEVSGAVRRVVDPAKLSWVDESRYDRSTHRATHRIVPDQYGGLLQCSYEEALEPASGGCVRAAAGTLQVRVPVVGRRVERVIVDGLRERAAAEARVLEAMATR